MLIEGHRVPYVFFLQYCNCVLCSLRRAWISLSLLCTVFNNCNTELQEQDPQRAETIRAGVIRAIASRAKLYEPEPFLLMQSKGAASALWTEPGDSETQHPIILYILDLQAVELVSIIICKSWNKLLGPRKDNWRPYMYKLNLSERRVLQMQQLICSDDTFFS